MGKEVSNLYSVKSTAMHNLLDLFGKPPGTARAQATIEMAAATQHYREHKAEPVRPSIFAPLLLISGSRQNLRGVGGLFSSVCSSPLRVL